MRLISKELFGNNYRKWWYRKIKQCDGLSGRVQIPAKVVTFTLHSHILEMHEIISYLLVE